MWRSKYDALELVNYGLFGSNKKEDNKALIDMVHSMSKRQQYQVFTRWIWKPPEEFMSNLVETLRSVSNMPAHALTGEITPDQYTRLETKIKSFKIMKDPPLKSK